MDWKRIIRRYRIHHLWRYRPCCTLCSHPKRVAYIAFHHKCYQARNNERMEEISFPGSHSRALPSLLRSLTIFPRCCFAANGTIVLSGLCSFFSHTLPLACRICSWYCYAGAILWLLGVICLQWIVDLWNIAVLYPFYNILCEVFLWVAYNRCIIKTRCGLKPFATN